MQCPFLCTSGTQTTQLGSMLPVLLCNALTANDLSTLLSSAVVPTFATPNQFGALRRAAGRGRAARMAWFKIFQLEGWNGAIRNARKAKRTACAGSFKKI